MPEDDLLTCFSPQRILGDRSSSRRYLRSSCTTTAATIRSDRFTAPETGPMLGLMSYPPTNLCQSRECLICFQMFPCDTEHHLALLPFFFLFPLFLNERPRARRGLPRESLNKEYNEKTFFSLRVFWRARSRLYRGRFLQLNV